MSQSGLEWRIFKFGNIFFFEVSEPVFAQFFITVIFEACSC